jgi:hypothetical protein
MAESVGTRRRQRWAERENRRRETDYGLRYERWSRIDAVLARWIDVARTFGGYEASASVPPDVRLKHNERVFGSFSGAALVEVNRPTGVLSPATDHYFSALSEAEGRAAPTATTPPVTSGEPRIKERGDLILTSSRVIFRGTSRHGEWRFDALVGIEHAVGQPLTLIHASSRKKASGFAVAGDLVPEMRFLLTLGLAHFRGDVAGFVQALETDRGRHSALQPVRPAPVGPEQAPRDPAAVAGAIGHFYFGRSGQPGRRRLAQATVTILGTLLLIGLVAPDRSAPPDGSTAAPTIPTPTTGPASTATPSPSPSLPRPSVRTTVPRTTARTTVAPPAPTARRTTPRPPPPAPRVRPLCGAPTNPYGYNFCGRGGLIYSPKPDICVYFECIGNFGNSPGYMIQCDDGMFSTAGGRQGACSQHGGVNRPVYGGP